MAFNPPHGVANGATYGYGNVVWQYDAVFGVWNIVDGTLVGGVGPKGATGPTGNPGAGNIPLATYALTGAAQFFNADFGVSVTGTVSLTGNVARTNRSNTFSAAGGNIFTAGITAPLIRIADFLPLGQFNGGSGYISFVKNGDGDAFEGGFKVYSDRVLLGDYPTEGTTNPVLHSAYIDIDNHSLPYNTENELPASGDPSYIRLGVRSSYMTLGPDAGLTLGAGYANPLKVSGGIFKNPEEFASYQDLGSSSSIVINATGGTIQRFRITPSGQVTVSAGLGWDNTTTNATETIAVIVQSTNGKTGNFASTILSNNPVLFGVTGGIDMFTVMRVKNAGKSLLIGLPIANGLTGTGGGTGFSIS